MVQFALHRDRSKVLEGRPWTFDQHLILMNDIDGSSQPSEIALTHSPFWVRLYNLPLDCRSKHHIGIIGGILGDVMEVEFSGISWDKSARLKVMMDITKPLRRIVKFRNSKGQVVIIEVKYERLPIFCYVCGTIGHIERGCNKVPEEEQVVEKQWGAWLRASPRRGRIKMDEEVKSFLNCSKSLVFEDHAKNLTSHAVNVGGGTDGEADAQGINVEVSTVAVSDSPIIMETVALNSAGPTLDTTKNLVSPSPISFAVGRGNPSQKKNYKMTKKSARKDETLGDSAVVVLVEGPQKEKKEDGG